MFLNTLNQCDPDETPTNNDGVVCNAQYTAGMLRVPENCLTDSASLTLWLQSVNDWVCSGQYITDIVTQFGNSTIFTTFVNTNFDCDKAFACLTVCDQPTLLEMSVNRPVNDFINETDINNFSFIPGNYVINGGIETLLGGSPLTTTLTGAVEDTSYEVKVTLDNSLTLNPLDSIVFELGNSIQEVFLDSNYTIGVILQATGGNIETLKITVNIPSSTNYIIDTITVRDSSFPVISSLIVDFDGFSPDLTPYNLSYNSVSNTETLTDVELNATTLLDIDYTVSPDYDNITLHIQSEQETCYPNFWDLEVIPPVNADSHTKYIALDKDIVIENISGGYGANSYSISNPFLAETYELFDYSELPGGLIWTPATLTNNIDVSSLDFNKNYNIVVRSTNGIDNIITIKSFVL